MLRLKPLEKSETISRSREIARKKANIILRIFRKNPLDFSCTSTCMRGRARGASAPRQHREHGAGTELGVATRAKYAPRIRKKGKAEKITAQIGKRRKSGETRGKKKPPQICTRGGFLFSPVGVIPASVSSSFYS